MLLSKELQDKILKLLIEAGLVDAIQVKKAYAEVRKSGQPILAVLTKKKLVTDDCLQHAMAVATKTQYVDLRNIRFDREKLARIPQEVAQRQEAIPIDEKDGVLVVAVLDTTNIQRVDYLSTLTGRPVKVILTSKAGIATQPRPVRFLNCVSFLYMPHFTVLRPDLPAGCREQQ